MRGFVQEIHDTSPEATPLMERINAEAQALLGTVEQVQANITEKQGALEEIAGRIQSSMDALMATAEEAQQFVEQQVAEVDAKTAELKETLTTIKDGVVSALDATQRQMEDYRGHIETGRQLVESANEAAQAVIGEVHDHVEAGREALTAATDFANDKIDGFQAKIDETLQATEQLASNLIEQVDTGIRETGAKVEEMIGVSFADLQSGFGTAMELLQGNVIENGVNMALDALQNEIQGHLNQIIDDLLAELVETLGRVREGLFGSAEEASLERKMLEPVLDQLGKILDPLFSAVDHIKGMAEMVGISV
jgi:ElaB/YqjD/DUF883 family membrane-anchored ribosome-binding protein